MNTVLSHRAGVDDALSAVEEFLHAFKQRGRRPKSVESYREFFGRFVREVGKPIQEITTRDIRRFLMDEEARGNKITTIASKTHRLRSLFKWLHREGIIESDPTARIDPPVLPKAPPKYLTHEEIELLREFATGIDRLLVEVLYSTGLRVSECVNLDWNDIVWEEHIARVREGKGGKDRIVCLSTRAIMLLRWHREDRKDNNPWVFQSQFRRRMSKESIERRIRILGERAGIKSRVTPHRLRHSLATHLLAGGMPIDQVQVLLGHSKVSSTQHYARTQLSDVKNFYRKVFP